MASAPNLANHRAMRRKASGSNAPFKVGDKVVPKHGEKVVLTVLWSSKNDTSRDEQLIATERNGYSNTSSYASLFEEARS